MAVGVVIYFKARAFEAKAKTWRPRLENHKAKTKKFGLKAKGNDLHPCVCVPYLFIKYRYYAL